MNYIFDFDGTIADSMAAFIAVFNTTVRDGGAPLSENEIAVLRNLPSRLALKRVGVRWWHIPKLLLKGIPEFHKLIPSLKPFEGLARVLSHLDQRGDKMFIVTSNTEDCVREFLKVNDLESLFSDIKTGSGLFKKAKDIKKIIRENGLVKKETLYIGDETRDIHAARHARVAPVSVTWGFNSKKALAQKKPRFMIDKPEQLLDIELESK